MKQFIDIEMPDSLQSALEKMGFVETTPIQGQSLPILLKGKDLVACSETGSGKTAAYVLPMVIQLLEDEEKSGLILAPTRELVQQINEFVDALMIHTKGFHVVRLVGGTDIRKQFKKLQKKPRLVVATPGRLIDHLKRNTIQLHKTEFLVLDEGDRMIDMGFAPQLKEILGHLPSKRQTSFFTATLDDKVKKLANQYLSKPEKVIVGTASRPVSAIKQNVVQVELKDKDECLVNELNARNGSIIVFLKTKYRTDRMCQYLKDYGFKVDQVHGGCTQGQRNKAIRNFKAGKIRVLCATDVAARGLDVPAVEHVINVDLPMQNEDYVHRIGRTARNGAEGEALSFVMPQEHNYWNLLVRKYEIADALLPEKKTKGRKKSGGNGRRTARNGDGKKSFGPPRGGSKGKGRPDKKKRFAKDDEWSSEKPQRKQSAKSTNAARGKARAPFGEKSEERMGGDDRPKRSFKGKFSGSRSNAGGKKTSSKTARNGGEGSGKSKSFKKAYGSKKSGGFKKKRGSTGSRSARS